MYSYEHDRELLARMAAASHRDRSFRLTEVESQLRMVTHERVFLHGESKLLEEQRDEARQVARNYRKAQLNMDAWTIGGIMEGDAETVARYPWLKEEA
jgi:hypothetical protein